MGERFRSQPGNDFRILCLTSCLFCLIIWVQSEAAFGAVSVAVIGFGGCNPGSVHLRT